MPVLESHLKDSPNIGRRVDDADHVDHIIKATSELKLILTLILNPKGSHIGAR